MKGAERSSRLATPGPDLFSACQRWSQRRTSYRPAGEPFDPSRYSVEIIEYMDGKRFIERNHYAASYVASRLQIGMWHKPSPFEAAQLAGVIAFSVPIQNMEIPSWFAGVPARHGVEIGRLALLDHVPGNGETFMLGRAFRLLRRTLPEVRAVLSYADPMERHDADGRLFKLGHRGTIYAAFSGTFLGRSTARRLILARDGRCLNERTLCKVRHGEQGAGYAERMMVAMGAPPRRLHEDGALYVKRALCSGAFRSVLHPGNYAFGWWIGHSADNPLPARETRRYPREVCSDLPSPRKRLDGCESGHTLIRNASEDQP